MPFLARITNTFFVTLINRLGVRPPPPEGFELSNVVQPVSIVDSDVTLSAVVSTQNLDVPASAGELVAPAAAVVLADSGALAVGNWNISIMVSSLGETNLVFSFAVERRDAANAANIWSQIFTQSFQATSGYLLLNFRATVLVNERIRVISRVPAAGTTVQANLWASL